MVGNDGTMCEDHNSQIKHPKNNEYMATDKENNKQTPQ